MRWRLMIAMLIVVGITIASVVGFAMVNTAREVNVYMFRGGMFGLNEMVDRLEQYYQRNGDWQGVDRVVDWHGMKNMPGNGSSNGMGMMNGSSDSNGTGMMNGGTSNNGTSNSSTPPEQPPNDANLQTTTHLILTDSSGSVLTRFRGKSDITQLTAEQMKKAIPLRADDNSVVGYLYTDESAPIQPGNEQPLTQKLFSSVRISALIGIGIAVLLSLLLGYWFLKPVRELTTAASALGKGDLNQRVPVHGKDELAQLGETFNNMAESLQRAEASRKAMTADIAHELRTPLAVQRATVEAMIDGVYPLDEANLKPVVEQNLLLTHLVDDLRTLALADAGELRLEKVSTEPARLAESVFNRFRTQADRQEVALDFQSTGQVPSIQADPIRLEQILTNLIGNALRFTPAKGTVRMRVLTEGDQVLMKVADSGPGIAPESLPYVFERFYRADKSRSREEGGSGLGLAIARHLARSHRGDLTARNREEGGAEFTLSLPVKS
jgi:signal transduction histidine kinase